MIEILLGMVDSSVYFRNFLDYAECPPRSPSALLARPETPIISQPFPPSVYFQSFMGESFEMRGDSDNTSAWIAKSSRG